MWVCLLFFKPKPLPEQDPTYSTPVQAPPTETSPGDEDYDDEEVEETSGHGMETGAIKGKR